MRSSKVMRMTVSVLGRSCIICGFRISSESSGSSRVMRSQEAASRVSPPCTSLVTTAVSMVVRSRLWWASLPNPPKRRSIMLRMSAGLISSTALPSNGFMLKTKRAVLLGRESTYSP